MKLNEPEKAICRWKLVLGNCQYIEEVSKHGGRPYKLTSYWYKCPGNLADGQLIFVLAFSLCKNAAIGYWIIHNTISWSSFDVDHIKFNMLETLISVQTEKT